MKARLIFLLTILFVSGCDDEKVTTQLLTLNVDASFDTSISDDWVVIHNADGNPVAVQTFESGDEVVLQTTDDAPGDEIGITIVRYFSVRHLDNYEVKSYLNYPKGGEFELRGAIMEPLGPGTSPGSFNVTVNATNIIHQNFISNKFGNGSLSLSSDQTSIDIPCTLNTDANHYILEVSDDTGDLRYKFLDNVQLNSEHVVSFSDMLPFDKTVTFTFPEEAYVTYYVRGHDPAQPINSSSYILNFHWDHDQHANIKLGYLNSVSKYITECYAGFSKYSLSYYNHGTVPENISEWPSKEDYSVTATPITNYSSTATAPYVYRSSRYDYNPQPNQRLAGWYVYSTAPTHKLKNLPQEILDAHPALSIDHFQYVNTAFFTEGHDYSDAHINIPADDAVYLTLGITILP